MRSDVIEKAKFSIAAKGLGDPRYFHLVMQLCLRTGLSAHEVEDGIRLLSEGMDPEVVYG